MNYSKLFFSIISAILIATSTNSADIKKKTTDKISSFKDGKINQISSQISESISSFAKDHFDSMKYLDFSIDAREHLKPTFSIMSVNEIMKIDSGTIFNQISINTHDSDETINIGFGHRELFNNNTLLLGVNTFYDHQLSENHERVGLGYEAISSIFDLRGNYYNAISGRRTNSEGTIEQALDGWNLRGDYHLPIDHEVNLFISAFNFENPEAASTYKEKGNKFGADAKLGNFAIETGYMNDNKDNDAWFGNIKFVVNFGTKNQSSSANDSLTLTDVSDKLYQPVKRENKIRVVKISKSGVQVSGF